MANTVAALRQLPSIAACTVLGNNGTSSGAPAAISVPMLIVSGTVTNQATATISWASYASLFSLIVVEIYGLQPATNNTTLSMQVSKNGSTFDSAASSYAYGVGFTSSGDTTSEVAGSAGATSIEIANVLANTSTVQTTLTIKIPNPGQTALQPTYMFDVVTAPNGGGVARLFGAGVRLTNQATEAISLFMSSGNITLTYRVYGY